MYDVGILEIGPHYHRTYSLCEICRQEETSVTVFTDKKGYSEVKDKAEGDTTQFNWVLKKEGESNKEFLERVERICDDEIDLLHVQSLIGTYRIFSFLFFNPDCKKILWVYNVKSWLDPDIPFKISDPRLTLACNANLIMRKLILPRYDAVNVQYSPMKKYILENTDYEKPVFSISSSVFEDSEPPVDDEVLRFVVPGAVHKCRKYEDVLNAFEDLFSEHEEKIELNVLGRPKGKYGYEILNRFKSLGEKGYKVNYFEDWIPQERYSEVFQKSDAVISPVRLGGIDINNEIRGTTHGTGFIFDCIEHARPFIVPREFDVAAELKSSSITYENAEEMKESISELLENEEKLRGLQERAMVNSEKFSLDSQRRYFREILCELSVGDSGKNKA